MENQAEENIHELQITIAHKTKELQNTGYWQPLRRRKLKTELYDLKTELNKWLKVGLVQRQ